MKDVVFWSTERRSNTFRNVDELSIGDRKVGGMLWRRSGRNDRERELKGGGEGLGKNSRFSILDRKRDSTFGVERFNTKSRFGGVRTPPSQVLFVRQWFYL